MLPEARWVSGTMRLPSVPKGMRRPRLRARLAKLVLSFPFEVAFGLLRLAENESLV